MPSSFSFILLSLLQIIHGSGLYDPDPEEKKWLIDEFRRSVENFELPLVEFMHSDGYVDRWLRTYAYDLDEALSRFEATLIWRKENQIDEIVVEDFSRLDAAMPWGIEGHDKDGRPVYWAPGGMHDARRVALSSEGNEHYQRFAMRVFELLEIMAHEAGANTSAQVVGIYDMAGFNVKQGGCLRCLGMMQEFVNNVETHYPSIFYRLYVINAPALFRETLRILQAFMHGPTLAAMRIFDYDKEKWSTELLSQIPATELGEEYGGERKGVHLGQRRAPVEKLLRRLQVRGRGRLELEKPEPAELTEGMDSNQTQVNNRQFHQSHHHHFKADEDPPKSPQRSTRRRAKTKTGTQNMVSRAVAPQINADTAILLIYTIYLLAVD